MVEEFFLNYPEFHRLISQASKSVNRLQQAGEAHFMVANNLQACGNDPSSAEVIRQKNNNNPLMDNSFRALFAV